MRHGILRCFSSPGGQRRGRSGANVRNCVGGGGKVKARQTICVVVLVMLGAALAQSEARRGPSTPEERARAIQVAHKLEGDPLNPQLQTERDWLLRWVIEIPDITVPVCQEVLATNLKEEQWSYKYAPELVGQELSASAVFMIQHPDQAEDDYAIYKAGLESALNAYETILKAQAKGGRWLPLDELVSKRKRGELDNYVKQAALKCMSGDLNTASWKPR